MWTKILLTLVVLFLMLAISAAAALGVWALTLNSELTQTRADNASLKSANDKLTAQANQLSQDSTKTQADLQAAQQQVSNLQDQLQKSQQANTSLTNKISAIQTKVGILYALEFDSESAFDTKVNSSGDDQLKKLWASAKSSNARDDFLKLWDYVIQSIADTAGVSLPAIFQSPGTSSG